MVTSQKNRRGSVGDPLIEPNWNRFQKWTWRNAGEEGKKKKKEELRGGSDRQLRSEWMVGGGVFVSAHFPDRRRTKVCVSGGVCSGARRFPPPSPPPFSYLLIQVFFFLHFNLNANRFKKPVGGDLFPHPVWPLTLYTFWLHSIVIPYTCVCLYIYTETIFV